MEGRVSGGIGVRRESNAPLVLIVDDETIDFVTAITMTHGQCSNDITLRGILSNWPIWSTIIESAIETLTKDRSLVSGWQSLSELDLAPPVHPEATLIFTAANYAAHTTEAESSEKVGRRVSTNSGTPYVFLKPMRSVVGPDDDIIKPLEVEQLDWEVELAVVIGRPGRRIEVGRAMEHVAGYLLCNDISARDFVQRADWPMFSSDWFAQKAFDTFTPMGPAFVPASMIDDPTQLRLQLLVGEEVMQDALASDMIFTIAEQISYASRFTTLLPGDIISTGTPSGVGMARNRYLHVGELMTARITGLGQQRNRIVAEEPNRD